MPVYLYKCEECEEILEVLHPVATVVTDCSKCKCKYSLTRIFNMPTIIKSDVSKQKAAGNIKKFIEDAKQDLEEQKKEIKR